MVLPTNFKVDVNTPEQVIIKIDVSERTMILGAVTVLILAALVKKLKK